MRKFHLVGFWRKNEGPQNVNRALIENSDGSMNYCKFRSRFLRRAENILKCIICPIIVFSGYAPKIELFISRLLSKKIIFISHGCLKTENEINKLEMSEESVLRERKNFNVADVVIAVSKTHLVHLSEVYPEIKKKIKYVNNGIDIAANFVEHENNRENDTYEIAVSGGNRCIKRNRTVCEAVKRLIHNGFNIQILCFGTFCESGEDLSSYSFVQRMGQMNEDEYYNCLKNVDLYVVNSEVESFGLVVGDAMNCGCSLLMSKNVGAIDIFSHLEDTDVIQDIWDIDEISEKIRNLLLNGNARRLFYSIDRDACSKKTAFENLKSICLNE